MIRKTPTYLLMILLVLFCWTGVSERAAGETLSENEVKAAYLFNFSKFVEWPEHAFASKSSPIVICILGDDPFGDILSGFESKRIQNRPISVVRTKNQDQVKSSHILYICDSEKKDLSGILAKVAGKACFTVSSVNDFASMGGMIGFVRKGNNIRFEANLDAIRHGELVVSSRLLNLAQIVKKGQ